MIQVGTLDVSGGALRDGAQFLNGCTTALALKTLVTLSQGFGYHAGHGFAGLPGDHVGEPVSFRVFHIERHRVSSLLYSFLAFFILPGLEA